MVMVSTGGFGAVYSMAYNSTVNLIHGTEILVLVLEPAQAQMFINLVAVMQYFAEQYWFSSNLLYFNIKFIRLRKKT